MDCSNSRMCRNSSAQQDPDWYFFNAHWRNQSVLEHLLWEDRGTAQEFQEATHVSIPCPFCGASFEGRVNAACV